jgi:hypothetical protein
MKSVLSVVFVLLAYYLQSQSIGINSTGAMNNNLIENIVGEKMCKLF